MGERFYRCSKCGFEAPRDVVGCVNILRIGLYGKMVPRLEVPKAISFKRPTRKYPRVIRVVPAESRQVAQVQS